MSNAFFSAQVHAWLVSEHGWLHCCLIFFFL
jgi:hypothetical protein